ncbi:PREDICTED: uncharacterized protein LOC18603006 isoform X1 [Theobroma cacao]|uniref:Uncharacterized protein LOC18603006 isoform X1 n=1 Tax=Theobroma cacao TaxID=3641 RepID=A0AB32V817_THECC|nr:PREDICTED: uncharacterized protein LOC18603006 isoform X1 [Theobroma cacao]
MGEVLLELEQNLRSGKEQLTLQEQDFFHRCKSKAVRQFSAGVIAGGGLAWTATWKLNMLVRLNVSVGAATIFGLWRFGSSLESCVDDVLALDGSRMQRELADIIVKKYRDDPLKMRLISKHFYSEEVFDDLTSEPRLRWRYRNFYSDNISHDQGTHDHSQNDSHNATPSDFHDNSASKKTDLRSKQIPVNSGIDLMADPLDCVFGYTETAEEIHHSSTSNVPSRAQSHAHKRAHRRHRLRHQEGSLGSHDE